MLMKLFVGFVAVLVLIQLVAVATRVLLMPLLVLLFVGWLIKSIIGGFQW